MRYFLDTEFMEGFTKPNWVERVIFDRKPTHYIDLISIGIVCEDGSSYYAVSNEYDYKKANKWVVDNVISNMYIQEVSGGRRNQLSVKNFHKSVGKSNNQIAQEIKNFVEYEGLYVVSEKTFKANPLAYLDINFYGYYSDYDWVLFCSLFGTMMNLPNSFPMFCIDVNQFLYQYATKVVKGEVDVIVDGKPLKAESVKEAVDKIKNLPWYPQQVNEHNALDDAKWTAALFRMLVLGEAKLNNNKV